MIEATTNSKSTTLNILRTYLSSNSLVASNMPANFGLALLDNATLNLTTFGGNPADSNSLILSPELLGDANADGKVDLTDLSAVLNNFGATSPDWTSGNFDHAQTIDLTDLSFVLNNFGLTNPNPTSSFSLQPSAFSNAPEPTTLALLLPAAFVARRRRHRA